MGSCPKCNADLPGGLSFCLQCGAPLSPEPAPASEKSVPKRSGPAQPPSSPAGAGGSRARPENLEGALPRTPAEVEYEPPRRGPAKPGEVLCRFCKFTLDLESEFCDQCGAPVEEAAPPGLVKPKPKATAPATPPSAQPSQKGRPVNSPPPTKAFKRPQSAPAKAPVAPPAPPAQPKVPPPAPAQEEPPPYSSISPFAEFIKKFRLLSPTVRMRIGIGLGGIILVILAWHFLRSKPASESPATGAGQAPGLPAGSAGGDAGVSNPPDAGNLPNPAPESPSNPEAEEILRLQNLAREAYIKGHYAEPVSSSAIAYSKRVLEVEPTDSYSRTLLENSVKGGKYQVQQALGRRDFGRARRVASALAQLLPGRKDVAGLKEDIVSAERGVRAPPASKPAQPTAPQISFRVYHMHSTKAPSERGPYCLGTLSAVLHGLKYAGVSASDRHVHNFEFNCADVKEIKKNSRVASKHRGFHIRTGSTNINFAPVDANAPSLTVLASACSQ